MLDPAWKDPFRQMIAKAAIKEHGNVEFWKTLGVGAVGMALFVVAELTTGGLATFFFAAAAAGGIAQAAASWDKYFTPDAAAGTNLTKESSLISKDQASDQLLTATIDTVMAFVGAYRAGKSGADALKAASTEQALAGIASKEEQQLIAAGAMETNGPKGPLIGPTAGSAAERASLQRRVQSTIRYMDPKTGQWHFSYFGYDPHLENSALGPFFANIETKGGARVDLSFRDMNELTNMSGRLRAGEEIPR